MNTQPDTTAQAPNISVTQESSPETVHLLWTGGWDSTFRLLDLLTHTNVRIQPHYFLSTRRPSTMKEVETMGKIRKLLAGRIDALDERLLPTAFYSTHEIPRIPMIAEKLERLRRHTRIPTQYTTLANLPVWKNLTGLEMSLVKTLGRDEGLSSFLRSRVVAANGPGGIESFSLRAVREDADESLFSPFRYPTIMKTKEDLYKLALDAGFLDILQETWFCHAPIDGKPCGLCAPCKYALMGRLGYRLGARARFRHRLSAFFFIFPSHRRRWF